MLHSTKLTMNLNIIFTEFLYLCLYLSIALKKHTSKLRVMKLILNTIKLKYVKKFSKNNIVVILININVQITTCGIGE